MQDLVWIEVNWCDVVTIDEPMWCILVCVITSNQCGIYCVFQFRKTRCPPLSSSTLFSMNPCIGEGWPCTYITYLHNTSIPFTQSFFAPFFWCCAGVDDCQVTSLEAGSLLALLKIADEFYLRKYSLGMALSLMYWYKAYVFVLVCLCLCVCVCVCVCVYVPKFTLKYMCNSLFTSKTSCVLTFP